MLQKVSVVFPVYNTEQYLEKCLDSILNQTYENIEIICVNDGSTDNSLAVLNDYASRDSRIQVYCKENEGKGAASARNMGLDYATGEYVLVLDSDDYFESDMVEMLVGRAEETKADVVITTAQMYDNLYQCNRGIFLRPELKWAPEKDPFSWKDCSDKIFQIADFVAWNKLFRRDFMQRHHIRFEAIPISDDQYPSVMGAVLADRISVIDKPLIHYRMNTGSSQCSSQARHPKAAYSAIFSVVNEMRRLGIFNSVKQSYLNLAILLMRQYFDRMDTYENIEFLYYKFRDEIFPFLGAENLPENYFYDSRVAEWYMLITKHSLGELLFLSSRAYGGDMTTAALRFQVPLQSIEKGSSVAVVGKGIAGRYWYAQLILSDYCKEVFWLSSEEELPDNKKVDYILKAK